MFHPERSGVGEQVQQRRTDVGTPKHHLTTSPFPGQQPGPDQLVAVMGQRARTVVQQFGEFTHRDPAVQYPQDHGVAITRAYRMPYALDTVASPTGSASTPHSASPTASAGSCSSSHGIPSKNCSKTNTATDSGHTGESGSDEATSGHGASRDQPRPLLGTGCACSNSAAWTPPAGRPRPRSGTRSPQVRCARFRTLYVI